MPVFSFSREAAGFSWLHCHRAGESDLAWNSFKLNVVWSVHCFTEKRQSFLLNKEVFKFVQWFWLISRVEIIDFNYFASIFIVFVGEPPLIILLMNVFFFSVFFPIMNKADMNIHLTSLLKIIL